MEEQEDGLIHGLSSPSPKGLTRSGVLPILVWPHQVLQVNDQVNLNVFVAFAKNADDVT